MADAVVVGGGPAAVRAAATLRAAGRSVVLLQAGGVPGGILHPEVPVGRGVSETPPSRVLGEMVPVAVERAVLARGRVVPLPMPPQRLFRLLSPTVHPRAARSLGVTRATVALRELIGGGKELRTYEDWVVQRFGRPIYESVHAPYCARRFGPPEEVTANAARYAHAPHEPIEGAPTDPARAWTALLDGVDVRTDVTVTALKSRRVETTTGAFEGDVYLDVHPARVVAWLGGAVNVAHEVERLRYRHAIEVVVAGGAALPLETHVLDGRAAFYRLVRTAKLPGCRDELVAHYAVDDTDPRWRAGDADVVSATVAMLRLIGVPDAEPGRGLVRRIPDHHPGWRPTHAARMRTYALALEPLGITPVGRTGLHARPTWAAEVGWIEAQLAGEPIRERMRRWVDPPVDGLTDPATLGQLITG